MVEHSVSLYAQWRLRCGAVPVLHETGGPPPERLLQAVWFHQRLQRDQLITIDGRRFVILHPGFWNREGGPDFRKAMLQFENGEVLRGDVEVDVHSAGWRGHGHDRNPAFRHVILHVIWEGEMRSSLPTLQLPQVLDAPLPELAAWLGTEGVDRLPELFLGQCCAPLAGLSSDKSHDLLLAAAHLRLQAKGARLQARAREAGWEQALWEGLFRGLGYKHNVWPMQRLGELRSRICAGRADLATIESRLFGLSGLLPPEVTRIAPAADACVRSLWHRWWRERAALSENVLPNAAWRLHGLRPANHPQRRLALATQWLASADIPARLERWCAATIPPAQWISTLWTELRPVEDPFWSWHWSLRSKRLAAPQPLLGEGRLTDLTINVILPWLWIRAVEGSNDVLRTEMERRFFGWPAGQDNAVLRLARERLFNGRHRLSGAAEQQGLLQIVQDFCEQSDAVCTRCQFPLLAKLWSEEDKLTTPEEEAGT